MRSNSHSLPPWLRHGLRTVLHLAADGAAIIAAYWLAYRIRFDFLPFHSGIADWSVYAQLLWLAVPAWIAVFYSSCRLYSGWMGFADRFLQIVKGCFVGAAAVMFAGYLYSRLEYSRILLVMAWPLGAATVTLSQFLVLKIDDWLAHHEGARPVLIVGAEIVAKVLKERIQERHPEAEVHELRELPSPAELDRILLERPFYELILLKSNLPHKDVLSAAEACEARGTGFKMVPDLLELRLGELQMDHSLGLPAYRIQHASMTRASFAAKRAFDLLFSGLLLAATLPFWLLVGLLIKLDSPGPILFTQKRYGFRSRVFEAFKFRTMVVDAEARVQAVKEQQGAKGAFFKAKDDPRVTRVGKWLRKFSLDEFPQFLNVLRGEMSVVGPRPLALTTGEVEQLEREFGATAKKRMNIYPGITGLWQVSGRSDVSSEQRFALDMFYIEHWSLGMDLEIILRTVPAMLLGKGAY